MHSQETEITNSPHIPENRKVIQNLQSVTSFLEFLEKKKKEFYALWLSIC